MNDLVTIEGGPLAELQAKNPTKMVQGATDMANALAEIINNKKLYKEINNRKFVYVEGWTTLGFMVGVVPNEVSNVYEEGIRTPDDRRFIATIELVQTSTGRVISRASAECGNDEKKWADSELYAMRSMAATRATSKACRLAFSWIMTLAGFEATPADEITGKAEASVQGQGDRNQNHSAPETQGDTIGFGKHKGMPWLELPSGYLEWLVNNANKDEVKQKAQETLDAKNKGATTTVNQSTDMANESQIRTIRALLEKKEISVAEMLECLNIESTDKIRAIDVNPIIDWIKDPGTLPDHFAS